MTLVNTNVLLDLVTNDPVWADWSIDQLEAASLAGPLLINDIIYAELAVRYERIEELDAFVDEAELMLTPFPRAACCAVSGRKGIHAVSPRRRRVPYRCAAGLSHRRASCCSEAASPDARCRPVSVLFSDHRTDIASLMMGEMPATRPLSSVCGHLIRLSLPLADSC